MPSRTILHGILFLFLVTLAPGCDDSPAEPEPFDVNDVQFAEELDVTVADLEQAESGLYFYDVVVGEGPQPDPDGIVVLHLTLWLADGTFIGDSRTDQEPIDINLGDPRTNLAPGLEEGLLGTNEGGIRILVVPPELGYGDEGFEEGGIPPNAGLVFRVELISVSPSSGSDSDAM